MADVLKRRAVLVGGPQRRTPRGVVAVRLGDWIMFSTLMVWIGLAAIVLIILVAVLIVMKKID
jgi:hypothetical protein